MSLTLLADENIPAVQHYLGAEVCLRTAKGRGLTRQQLQGVDALFVRSVTRVDEALLGGSDVRFVGTATSGFDHVDRDYLAAQGIAFVHAPGSNANSVVEYVLAAIAHQGQLLEQLLQGGRVGIVGHGYVGSALAARLRALGIAYRVYDPWLDPSTLEHAAPLSEVLACDVLSLHAELTHARPWPSFHLLGAEELAQLRPGSLLINASRGPVVDNSALLECLRERNDLKVVLDVWEGEPAIDPALLARVSLGTAHIAGYSLDGKVLATSMLCSALASHLGLRSPCADSPLAPAPVIFPPPDLTDGELLRYLLHSRYDITSDDQQLRAVVGNSADAATRAAGFDQLRKAYPQRRELRGAVVRGALSASGATLVRALGCIYETTGQPT